MGTTATVTTVASPYIVCAPRQAKKEEEAETSLLYYACYANLCISK